MKYRKANGAATIVLTIIIAVFVLLACGLFACELNRAEVAREQLRSVCESASLAGAATLASQDNTDVTAAQTLAINTAIYSFQQNSLVGTSLSSAVQTYTNPDSPSADNSSLYVDLLDPHNNYQPVNLGDSAGKVVRVTGFFGLRPLFGAFLGIPSVPIKATALSGVPQMDIALCFDVSGSMDDQTEVTFVKRYWNSTTGKINYSVASTSGSPPAGKLAQGKIFDILSPNAIGTIINGVYPQYLSYADYNGLHNCPLDWSESVFGVKDAQNLRGSSDNAPPGNKYPGSAGLGHAQTFTDLVVNIDGNAIFGGITSGGYSFPDLATLVEAARGNLENATVFASSGANTSVAVTPKAGYKAKYQLLAAACLHPIADAQSACQTFLDIMNTNTDAHFCLIGFTTSAGTGTFSQGNVDPYWSAGGTGSFANSMVALSKTSSNFTTANTALPTTVALEETNIGSAVSIAVDQLSSNSRTGSKKAIVLFTDGQPTAGNPLNSDPLTNARQAAVKAKNAGIPIYTVGLAQNTAIVPGETAILNDTNSNTSTGGMAAIAGNGGKFFIVNRASDLRATFENIARQLVELVR